MDIILSNSSDKPLYEQITSQIKNMIMTGTLQAGEALPSMRLLAKELHISLITTKRAYEDLERDGYIETLTGRGSFVASGNEDILKERHYQQVEGFLQQALDYANMAGMKLSEVQEMLELLNKEEK